MVPGGRIRPLVGAVAAVVAVVAGCSGAGTPQPDTATTEATVVHIVDGDTFDVTLPGGGEERIRPPQIDTPEIGECGHGEASSELAALILGETVMLVPTADGPDRDAHGRLLRAVELNGTDVGELLVLAGLARWVPRYAQEDRELAARYEAAEAQARDAATGLWSTCDWS
ncbi:MAG TPA: thermonuclease family protein [Jiangellaceae bacterium]|nr:thermonuclease family protein [Jiangellaceae bacterium]